MNSIIDQTNIQVKDKGARLQQKVEMMLKGIHLKTCSKVIETSSKNNGVKGKLYWTIAGITAVIAILAPYKPVSIAICGCAVMGGVKSLMSNNSTKQTIQVSNGEDINLLSNQLIDVVKSTKSEWDDFMEQKKQIVQNFIKSCSIDEETRSKMYSFSYTTESIIFSVSDVISEMNKISSSTEFETAFFNLKNSIKEKLCAAIDSAVSKQIKKYEHINSLTSA